MKILSLLLAWFQLTFSGPGTSLTGSFSSSQAVSYFQDDWESCTWTTPKWGFITTDNPAIPSVAPSTTASTVYAGACSGYINYVSATGSSVEGYGVTYFDAGHGFPGPFPVNHAFIRMVVRWHDNTAPVGGTGRKLYYVQPADINHWHFTLAVDQASQKLHASSSVPLWSTGYGPTVLTPDTWYSIKMEFQFRGAGSDVVRVWVNNSLETEGTNLDLRGAYQSDDLYAIRIGDQSTTASGQAMNEERRFDNLLVANYDPGD